MEKKYYTVVVDEKENLDHKIKRFNDRSEADSCAKARRGKLYEHNEPLKKGDNHKKGKLIEDYSSPK